MLEASEEEAMEEAMEEDDDGESPQMSDDCPDWDSEENFRGPPPGGFRTWIAYRAAQAKKEHAYHEAQAKKEGMTMEQYWRAWGRAEANGAAGAAEAKNKQDFYEAEAKKEGMTIEQYWAHHTC